MRGATRVLVTSRFPALMVEQPALIREASMRAAEAIRENVAGGGPDAAPIRTGQLRDSYKVEEVSDLEFAVGSDLRYAPYVEFGTMHAAAQPHLRPAAAREGGRYYARILQILRYPGSVVRQ